MTTKAVNRVGARGREKALSNLPEEAKVALRAGKARLYEDGLTQRLQDTEYAAEYINAAMELDDQGVLLMALRDVAKARRGGVAGVAKAAGMHRTPLSRALSETGNPELRSFRAVLKAAGLRLRVEAEAGQREKRRRAA